MRRFVKAGDFSHELKRSGSNLFVRDWRVEVEKGLDVPTHLISRYQNTEHAEV